MKTQIYLTERQRDELAAIAKAVTFVNDNFTRLLLSTIVVAVLYAGIKDTP